MFSVTGFTKGFESNLVGKNRLYPLLSNIYISLLTFVSHKQYHLVSAPDCK